MDYLLRVENLKKWFAQGRGFFSRQQDYLKAVNWVSFDIGRGETLGLVGESGSGKTTVARCILRLVKAGAVYFEDVDLLTLDRRRLRKMRRDLQMIFQDPHSSLNPRMRIGATLREPLVIHKIARRKEQVERVADMLKAVNLDPGIVRRYPHEFSTGQRQRIAIARALILEPKLVIADEPVSALDVSTQVQILDLLVALREKFRVTFLFISHGLPIVERIAQRVAVMYLGKIVEMGTTDAVCRHPRHPYTQSLVSAVPVPDPDAKRERILLKGALPSLVDYPTGCPFHTRCPVAIERCRHEEPKLITIEGQRQVACHLVNG
jgi:peptide/nickel transport system ATP-binding protein/oligopeptide transport system ATP-binding protein